jgi:transposase
MAMAKGRRPGLRIATAERQQTSFEMMCLDDLLASDHRAREVWAYVEACDLSSLYEKIRAVEGDAGRPPIDPAILMGLWLYATLEGVGSARQLERLCKSDHAYRWLCGGVGVNYHTLADFRIEAGAVLDALLTRSMAALVAAGVVGLDSLMVDGLRVRASAGASSFRRRSRLVEMEELARQKVTALREELEADPNSSSDRRRRRQLQEAEARERRLAAAHEAAKVIEEERLREAERQRRSAPKNKSEPRASTTDEDARNMKMADGGYRPAYNVQLKTDEKSGLIVGVDITNRSSDRGQLLPALDEVERRYGRKPGRVLADGGFDSKDDIEALHDRQIEVFCPVPGSRGQPVPAAPKRGEGAGVMAWRERMSKEESYKVYRQRIICEHPHAHMRNRGLQQFIVRGMEKAKAVVLWHVHAFNFQRTRGLAVAVA